MDLRPEHRQSSDGTLGILAYVSGNAIMSDYLNIMYLPSTGELVVYISAFIGALIGFLWYNSYPAQVFMGDTGSLAIGGIIAVFAILIRKELLIPILCGIFVAESLSVVIQVAGSNIPGSDLVKAEEFSECHHFIIIFRNSIILNQRL